MWGQPSFVPPEGAYPDQKEYRCDQDGGERHGNPGSYGESLKKELPHIIQFVDEKYENRANQLQIENKFGYFWLSDKV